MDITFCDAYKHNLSVCLIQQLTYSYIATLKTELKETVTKTLQEYETTLKNQTAHIQQLEGEREMIHSHNEELEQKCTDLEFRLNKATVSRDALSARIEEITQSLDGM